MSSPGESYPRAEPTTRRDLLLVGAQLLHGLQPWQRFPCRLSLRDHVHPCISLHRTQRHQLLWNVANGPQRGYILVPQVRSAGRRSKKINAWVMVSFFFNTLKPFCLFLRMHLALKAYQELLLTVNEMDRSPDESIRQSSNVIKSKALLISVWSTSLQARFL